MNRYKSLIGWQRASDLSVRTLETVDDAWHPRAAVVFDQLRRAALSVDLNIVEGYALNTPALFRRHIRIAIGSAAETERLLEIAERRGYLSVTQVGPLRSAVDGTLRALFGLLRSPKLRRRVPR